MGVGRYPKPSLCGFRFCVYLLVMHEEKVLSVTDHFRLTGGFISQV